MLHSQQQGGQLKTTSHTTKKQDKTRRNKASKKKHSKEKSKKGKKAPKKRTATEAKTAEGKSSRAEELAKKAQEKALAQKVLFAKTLLNKVAAPLASLSSVLAKPESMQLPECVMTSATERLKELQTLEKWGKLVQADPSKTMPVTTMKEVGTVIQKAQKCESLIQQMLTNIGQLSSPTALRGAT